MGFECGICFELLEKPPDTTMNITNSMPSTSTKRPRRAASSSKKTSVVQNQSQTPSECAATPCGHLFHFVCIHSWLGKSSDSSTCPNCRKFCSREQLFYTYPTLSDDTEDDRKCLEDVNKQKEKLKAENDELKLSYADIKTELGQLKVHATTSEQQISVLTTQLAKDAKNSEDRLKISNNINKNLQNDLEVVREMMKIKEDGFNDTMSKSQTKVSELEVRLQKSEDLVTQLRIEILQSENTLSEVLSTEFREEVNIKFKEELEEQTNELKSKIGQIQTLLDAKVEELIKVAARNVVLSSKVTSLESECKGLVDTAKARESTFLKTQTANCEELEKRAAQNSKLIEGFNGIKAKRLELEQEFIKYEQLIGTESKSSSSTINANIQQSSTIDKLAKYESITALRGQKRQHGISQEFRIEGLPNCSKQLKVIKSENVNDKESLSKIQNCNSSASIEQETQVRPKYISEFKDQSKLETGCCYVCGNLSTLKCAGCSSLDQPIVIYYCSIQHQAEHWTLEHKFKCGYNRMLKGSNCIKLGAWTDQGGIPCIVAAKGLNAGSILFKKSPLLFFPRVPSLNELDKLQPGFEYIRQAVFNETESHVCLGCLEIVKFGLTVNHPDHGIVMSKCKKCFWPLHSVPTSGKGMTLCEKVHKEECEILTKNKLFWDSMEDKSLAYDFVGIVRALLLPFLEQKILMNFPSMLALASSLSHSLETRITRIIDLLRLCGFTFASNRLMILQIFNNILPVPYGQVVHNSIHKFGFVIYKDSITGRVISHGCVPNTACIVDPRTFEATFKTVKHMLSNQRLFINYLQEDFLPVNERSHRLSELFIACSCFRCTTPTEGETYYSAIRCNSSQHQNSIHYSFPNDLACAEWKCMTCNVIIKKESVDKLVEQIKSEIKAALTKDCYSSLEYIVRKYSGNVVHPSHFTMHFVEFKMALIVKNRISMLGQYKEPEFQFSKYNDYSYCIFGRVLNTVYIVQSDRPQYRGIFLFYRTLLLIADLIGTKLKNMSDVNRKIGFIVRDLDESWAILKRNDIGGSNKLEHENSLKTLYVNSLVSSIEAKFGIPDPSELKNSVNFKLLKENYFKKDFILK